MSRHFHTRCVYSKFQKSDSTNFRGKSSGGATEATEATEAAEEASGQRYLEAHIGAPHLYLIPDIQVFFTVNRHSELKRCFKWLYL